MQDLPLGPAAGRVLDSLLGRIQAGELAAGSRLPPERDLAEALGVARNTLRQALDRLEEAGWLVRRVGLGTFVRESRPAQPASLSGRMRAAAPADLMEVRLVIEPAAAALAASRAGAEDLERIEALLRHSVAAKGLAEFEHWDAQLHLSIFQATKNAVLIDYCEAINAVRNEPNWYRLKKRSVTPELRLRYDQQHSAIVQALRDRDPESARRLTWRHLSTVRDSMLGGEGWRE